VPICLFGMSYALRHGEHVRVDVLFQYFTPRNKHLVDVITAILAMLLSLIVIRLSVPYVMQSWDIGEGSANPGGLDYRYVVKSLIPIGFALFFVQSLSEAIKSYLAFREPDRVV
jgi:TRAP-type mannitol/chloroaromatic compound transport system permease small subunit